MAKEVTFTIIHPQFERGPSDASPAAPPSDWEALRSFDRNALRELGCRTWNDPTEPDDEFGGMVLMLFPGEWYRHIPAGYGVTNIRNQKERFAPEMSDDDIRHGWLPYGLKVAP